MVLGRSFPYSGLLTDSNSEQPGRLKALFYGPALRRLTVLWPSYREAETAPRAAAEITSNHHAFFLASPSKTLPLPCGICFLGAFKMPFPYRVGIAAERLTWSQQPGPCPVHWHLRLQRPAHLCQSGNTYGTAADSTCGFHAGVLAWLYRTKQHVTLGH